MRMMILKGLVRAIAVVAVVGLIQKFW